MPDVYYVRPSNFLSDSRDRTIITGDSEDEVLGKVYDYLRDAGSPPAVPGGGRPDGTGKQHPQVHFR